MTARVVPGTIEAVMQRALMIVALVLAARSATAADDRAETLRAQAMAAYRSKDYASAEQLVREARAASNDPEWRQRMSWALACVAALRGHRRDSLDALAEAVNSGYADWQQASVDEDLESVRGTSEFRRLIATMKRRASDQQLFTVTRWDNPDLGWAGLHRFEDWADPKLAELRTRYQLQGLVAGRATELDRQLAVLAWVHNRWPHDGSNEPSHEDALTILREVAEGKHFRCVEYSTTLAQALQALGFPARSIGLRREGVSWGHGKGHVVTEVWNNELGKWILLDGQNNATWEQGGLVLNAAEVRERYLGVGANKVRMIHHGSSWLSDWKPEAQRLEWIRYFHHLSYRQDNALFAERSDRQEVELLRRGEAHEVLFQGQPIAGHAQTLDPARIYPALNRVHIDIGTTGRGGTVDGALTLTFTNSTPWFAAYEIEDNGRTHRQNEGLYRWSLQRGDNRLAIRAVNQAGLVGAPTVLEVAYRPSPGQPGRLAGDPGKGTPAAAGKTE
jgi:hypothetical protein